MELSVEMANVVFELSLDCDVAYYFYKRVRTVKQTVFASPDVSVICKQQKRLTFTNQKFVHQQEPDFEESGFYREIVDLGIFQYNRKEKILEVNYVDTEQYPYNSFEVVVDTILQFMYLIMLDFNIVPLHASVVTCEDFAVLIFGNSGSGKTTLELSFLANGFRFFSDDIAFLSESNTIYNSGEHIVACSKKTIDIIKNSFDIADLNNTSDLMSGKYMIDVPETLICQYKEVKPFVIVLPTVSDNNTESIEPISAKRMWLELIEMSISKQFSSYEKQMYMKRLKALCENSIAFRYIRTNGHENILKDVCDKVKDMYMKRGVEDD